MGATPEIQLRGENGFSISLWKRSGQNGDFYSGCLQHSFKRDNETEWTREQVGIAQWQISALVGLLLQAQGEIKNDGKFTVPLKKPKPEPAPEADAPESVAADADGIPF